MKESEEQIERMILEALPDGSPSGLVLCDAGEGYVSHEATFKLSQDSDEEGDLDRFLPGWEDDEDDYEDCEDEDDDEDEDEDEEETLAELLYSLYESSRSLEGGPWYRCAIEISPSSCAFKYWREDPQVTDLTQLPMKLNGRRQMYPFRTRFSEQLLGQLQSSEYELAVFEYLPCALSDSQSIPAPLREFAALIDWESDTSNGGFNQYFARDHDCFGAGAARSKLYPLVLRALNRIHPQAIELFREGIALFAHFYPRVEEARQAMQIPAVEKQTESDIQDRYYDMLSDLEQAQWEYFAANIPELAVAE